MKSSSDAFGGVGISDNNAINLSSTNEGLMDGRPVERSRPMSNNVQKITICLTSLAFAMLVVIVGITAASFTQTRGNIYIYTPNVTVVQQAVGLPGYTQLGWSDVLVKAKGTTLKTLYQINLVRIPSSALAAVQLVESQVANVPDAQNVSVDLIWINLENFNRMRNPPTGGPSNAYGPWAFKVPSAANFDFTSPSIAYDGGNPTAGYEFPYDGAQCVFIYNGNKVTSAGDLTLLQSITGIKTWIMKNPGRFTYPAPSSPPNYDYTGSAFVRHVFYTVAAPYTDFLGLTPTTDKGLYATRAPKFYQFLRAIEPYLYSASGSSKAKTFIGRNQSYPVNNTLSDQLFGQAITYLTMSYAPAYAATQVASGVWPLSTNPQGYVLNGGTLSNTNFVAIATNSKNKLGAVVAANFLGSAQANYYRAFNLGSVEVYDPYADAFTNGGWQVAMGTIPRSPRTPSIQQLAAGRLAELSNDYITQIQNDWYKCVVMYNYNNATRNPKVCG